MAKKKAKKAGKKLELRIVRVTPVDGVVGSNPNQSSNS